jgi:hypothetical protein
MTQTPERIWATMEHRRHWDDKPPESEVRAHHTIEYVRADLSPAVKPLGWESYEPNVYRAATEIGEYVVSHGDLHTPFMGVDSKRRPHKTPDDAKAAAQADYERRILSALTTRCTDPLVEAQELTRQLRQLGYLVPSSVTQKALRALAEEQGQ